MIVLEKDRIKEHLDIQKTICFTGHRPKDLFGYQAKEPYIRIINTLKPFLSVLYENGYTDFISGGAQGFDQLAFWAVHHTLPNANNHVFIPFYGQEIRWKEKGLFGQDEYQKMLKLATTVTDCSNGETNLDFGQAVIRLMNRNKQMILASSATIALFEHDKDYKISSGGTAATIRKSLEYQHPVILLDPNTLDYKVIQPSKKGG